ncbi:hypothetical protein BVRB_7g159740 [Beta vulgaris subsp. vulgaris]|nr:hypothetical protein BVRB_7g159740 [Beta vulgaris subsp. vulgaris]
MKKKTRKNHHLPREILEEIFNRVSLPIKTITGCKNLTNLSEELSCIFSDSKFDESQSKQYTRPCILAYGNKDSKTKIDQFLLIEKTERKILSTEFNVNFMANHASTNLYVLDSCNGLLLLEDHDRRLLCVVNPLTQEFISLPRSTNQVSKKGHKSYYALGYSTKSDKYKVVRLVGNLRDAQGGYYLEYYWHVEVLTLGTNKWRKIDGCDLVLQNGCIDEGPIMINGALYWLSHIGHRNEIVRFEIELEEFKLIQSPLNLGCLGYSLSSLNVVDNMLCVGIYETKRCNDSSHGMEMWVMNDNCGVWNIWKKNVVIYDNMNCVRKFKVIQVSENKELLFIMLVDALKLVYYDTTKRTAMEARVYGIDKKMNGVVFSPNLRSISTCIKDVQ